jgi:hypothetical protein
MMPEASVRDVLIVLLGSVMMSMEMNKKMTVGQATDALLMRLDREGYKIVKK